MRLRVSSPFGPRVHPTTGRVRHHGGLDLALPQGTPLRPIASGRVVRVWVDDPTEGTGVVLDHGGGWTSTYLHLSELRVTPGAWLTPASPLGRSGGAPGTWGAGRSTGPHLHLAVSVNGRPVDPAQVITWAPFTLS
jgi:murein DD-endopeptidase MepM/ murein hydrolase activator NlpD